MEYLTCQGIFKLSTSTDIFVKIHLFAKLAPSCIWAHELKLSSRNIWNSSYSSNGCVKTFPLFLPKPIPSSNSEVRWDSFYKTSMFWAAMADKRHANKVLEVLQKWQGRGSHPTLQFFSVLRWLSSFMELPEDRCDKGAGHLGVSEALHIKEDAHRRFPEKCPVCLGRQRISSWNCSASLNFMCPLCFFCWTGMHPEWVKPLCPGDCSAACRNTSSSWTA